MSRRSTATDSDIVAMINEGHSVSTIARELHVGLGRISKVRHQNALVEAVAEFEGEKREAPVDTDDVDDAPETVVVSAEYLRALEAIVYLVEQNQRLHLAVANG